MWTTCRILKGGRSTTKVEPAIAFQLELFHISSCNLTPSFAQGERHCVHHSIVRETQLGNCLFVLALARPGRVRGGISMSKCLIFMIPTLASSTRACQTLPRSALTWVASVILSILPFVL